MPFYPNGIGEALGDTLATAEPLITSGDIWYVKSTIGADAASPRGLDATRPLATLNQAVTNSASGDIIVLLDGHTETLATGGTITISKNLTIVGSGSSSGLPTAKITPQALDALAITCSGAGIQWRNVWFEERTAASTSSFFSITGARFQMIGCYAQLGANDAALMSLGSGADGARLVNTTVISTATALASQPTTGIRVTAAIADLDLDGLVLDNGGYGFSSPYAFDNTTTSVAITRLKGQSVSLLRGADMSLHASTTGHVNVQTATGNGRVLWAGM